MDNDERQRLAIDFEDFEHLVRLNFVEIHFYFGVDHSRSIYVQSVSWRSRLKIGRTSIQRIVFHRRNITFVA